MCDKLYGAERPRTPPRCHEDTRPVKGRLGKLRREGIHGGVLVHSPNPGARTVVWFL